MRVRIIQECETAAKARHAMVSFMFGSFLETCGWRFLISGLPGGCAAGGGDS